MWKTRGNGGKTLRIIQAVSRRGHYESLLLSLSVPPPHSLSCFVPPVLLAGMHGHICPVNRPISDHLLRRIRKWKRTNCELDDLKSEYQCCVFDGRQPLLQIPAQRPWPIVES